MTTLWTARNWRCTRESCGARSTSSLFKADNETPSKRTPRSGGISGSSKSRLTRSNPVEARTRALPGRARRRPSRQVALYRKRVREPLGNAPQPSGDVLMRPDGFAVAQHACGVVAEFGRGVFHRCFKLSSALVAHGEGRPRHQDACRHEPVPRAPDAPGLLAALVIAGPARSTPSACYSVRNPEAVLPRARNRPDRDGGWSPTSPSHRLETVKPPGCRRLCRSSYLARPIGFTYSLPGF
jgi:hypothetical protein